MHIVTRWIRSAAALMLWFMPSTAVAQGYLRMGWDDCGDAGRLRQTFSCADDAGAPFEIVMSVVLGDTLRDLVGFTAVLDLDFQQASGPAWWDFDGCRPPGQLVVAQASQEPTCTDLSPLPMIVLHDYLFGYGYPGRARVIISGAMLQEGGVTDLVPDLEYSVVRLRIGRRGTVGAGSCEGCEVPVCISARSLVLTDARGEGRYIGTGYEFLHWQEPLGCPFVGSPAARGTWGQIKSRYRE